MLTQALNIAQKHKHEGRSAFALTTLSGSLLSAISHVVCTTPSADAGLAMFRDIGIIEAFREFTALNRWALAELTTGPVKSAVVNEPTLLCLAWFCGDSESAASLVDAIRSFKVQSHFPLVGFWFEFATGLVRLSERQAYDVPPIKAKGYQRYLMPYLHFIADLSQGRDTRASLEEVDRAFQARNGDRRFIDWRSIDGDGKRPVRWDFRRETLLRYKPAA
jgi:hypothetical protein